LKDFLVNYKIFNTRIFILVFFFINISILNPAFADSISVLNIEKPEHILKISERSFVFRPGFTEEAYRFQIKTPTESSKAEQKYLVFLWSHLDFVRVCFGLEPCMEAGYSIPISKWPVPQIFPIFPIPEDLGNHPIDIQIQSKNFIETEIQVLTTSELLDRVTKITGLVFGFIIFILAFVSRLAYLSFLKKQIWIFLNLGFQIGILFVFFFGSGMANLYLFPETKFELSLFKKISVGFLTWIGTAWVTKYLQIELKFPKTYLYYKLVLFSCVVLTALVFFPVPRIYISFGFTFFYTSITLLTLILAIVKNEDSLKQSPWFILSLLSLLLLEILNIFSYGSFNSSDGTLYLIFLAIFLPANAYFVSKTITEKLEEIQTDETLFKDQISYFETDLIQSIKETETSPKKSTLSTVNTEDKIDRLKRLFEDEKIHREEELRLSDLSLHLRLSIHQTSELLNQILGTSFADIVKEYRVKDAVQKLIHEPERSILDIALDCGFTSKSVFNDSFKKYQGITPSEFRKSLQKKGNQ